MSARKPLTDESLRELKIPRLLRESMLRVDALGLEQPEPGEKLVQSTLELCREALAQLPGEQESDAAFAVLRTVRFPPVLGQAGVDPLGQLVAAFSSSFNTAAVRYAQRHPGEPAVVLIDRHDVIEPFMWRRDPALALFNGTLQGANNALHVMGAAGIDRVIVMKDDPAEYDEADVTVIRDIMDRPSSTNTYLIPARDAEPIGRLQCAVVGEDMVFEIGKGTEPGALLVGDPLGHRDPTRVSQIRKWLPAARQRGIAVHAGATLRQGLSRFSPTAANFALVDFLTHIR